ncbi:CPBP family intramembrane glutamic endopeptidase [Haladaptatus sp. GCM10025707]|uniref:CPBP family intramembrane glutamic endopeptidase n=1 Tax=unclassified Haladaptatus TaxID=2622732 RepID=UPI0023E853E1|nr:MULTISPECIES: CPBP family intramembrane glutamic endopeptidase [unclassified Haladaptatus]
MATEALRRRLPSLSWVQLALLWGAILTIVWMEWETTGLNQRVVRESVVYIVGPATLALFYGKHLGWRVDRLALKNTVLLALFVLPFYIVGSSLPSVRTYYPMWETGAALGEFLPHTVKQFVVVVAAETYYRGLLCVSVREIGFKSVFISPIVYTFHHLGKPPIEILLSGPTDVLFGAVDYKSNSILPSIVAHGMGLALLDWLVLHDPLIPPEQVLSWLRWLPIPL